MIAWKRKTDSNGDLDPLVIRLEKRILPCLLNLGWERGLRVRNLVNIITSHIWCFRCDQVGHYAKDYKKFPSQGKQGGRSNKKRFHA